MRAQIACAGTSAAFGVRSDFTWQAWAVLRRQNSENFGWYFGYRALGYDYEDGSGLRYQRYDMVQHGPGTGVAFSL